jgi:hypothetical protein
MAVLIFRRPMHARDSLPYSSWLRDLDEPIVLFTLGHDPEDEFFSHVERFDSFDNHGLTEIRAVELAESFPFTHIFAQSEHDILRVAQLRDWFGLAGQSYNSARAYRDKFYMKTLARGGGVELPPFAELATPLDLYRFVAEQGFPCVVKPRSGAGSRGVRVLRSMDDLKGFLQQPLPQNYMAEAFVEGDTFHVDGLITDGRILFTSASRYFNSSLSFQSGESVGCTLLDPAQELSRRLVASTEKLLAALPSAPHFVFHAEFFLDPNDRILLCEVASRPGGSRVVDTIEAAYGINLYEQWVRRSFGLPIDLPPLRPWFSVGRLFVPPRRGRLLSLPASVPFDWVIDYRLNSAPGQRFGDPEICAAHIASFLVTGSETEQVESRMQQLDSWFLEQVEWEDAPPPCPA